VKKWKSKSRYRVSGSVYIEIMDVEESGEEVTDVEVTNVENGCPILVAVLGDRVG
jgi:hypothetical protein